MLIRTNGSYFVPSHLLLQGNVMNENKTQARICHRGRRKMKQKRQQNEEVA